MLDSKNWKLLLEKSYVSPHAEYQLSKGIERTNIDETSLKDRIVLGFSNETYPKASKVCSLLKLSLVSRRETVDKQTNTLCNCRILGELWRKKSGTMVGSVLLQASSLFKEKWILKVRMKQVKCLPERRGNYMCDSWAWAHVRPFGYHSQWAEYRNCELSV